MWPFVSGFFYLRTCIIFTVQMGNEIPSELLLAFILQLPLPQYNELVLPSSLLCGSLCPPSVLLDIISILQNLLLVRRGVPRKACQRRGELQDPICPHSRPHYKGRLVLVRGEFIGALSPDIPQDFVGRTSTNLPC